PSRLQPVHVDTLDAYCQRHQIERIDYLKIDTEGHELSVFHGMQGMLDQERIQRIQFEYSGGYLDAGVTLRDIVLSMRDRPYRLYKILPTQLLPVAGYAEEHET